MSRSAVMLQVRMDSSRLPGKALKSLGGRAVIEHAMEALKRIPADKHILVTAAGDESYFQPLAQEQGFLLFAGSRNDVLDRYVQAARQFGIDTAVRATGDNPFVAFEPASFLLEQLIEHPEWDYTAMRGLPLGCGVEVFRIRALEESFKMTDDPYDHEHVTPYIYNHPDQFTIHYFDAPAAMASDGRVTLDTLDDYNRLTCIFQSLYQNEPIGIEDLVRYLKFHG